MKIISERGLSRFEPWSGAVDTFEIVQENGKIDLLESILDDLYPDGMTDTQLNDLLWFDEKSVFEWLGIKDPYAEDDEEDEEDEN